MSIPPPGSDTTPEARRKRVGAYAKLLANYASDDAIIDAGEAAELLFVRGLAFCATSDADGYITDAQVARYVGAGMKDAARRAVRLAQVGLWERVDGGYVVRSWLKIHDSTAEKGRQRAKDRERKKAAADSVTASERNPGGIQTEGSAESLSLIQSSAVTQQSNDTTEQVDSSSRGNRPEPLRAVAATEPPNEEERPASNGAVCSRHPNGNPDDKPCRGCQKVEERRARDGDRAAEAARRDAEARARDCTRCDGVKVIDPDTKLPTKQPCDHTRRSA